MSQGFESGLNFAGQGVKVKYKMNNRKIQAPEYRKSPILLFKALTVITLSSTYFCGNYYLYEVIPSNQYSAFIDCLQ